MPVAGVYERYSFSWSFPGKHRVYIRYVSGPSPMMCFRIIKAVDKTGNRVVGGGACISRGSAYAVIDGVEGEAVVSIMFPRPGKHVVELAGRQMVVDVATGDEEMRVDDIVIGYGGDGRLYIGILLNRGPRPGENKPVVAIIKARKLEPVNGQYRVIAESTKKIVVKPTGRTIKHYITLPQGTYDITVCTVLNGKTVCRTRRIHYYTTNTRQNNQTTTTQPRTTKQPQPTYTIYKKQPMHLKTPLVIKR